MPEGRAIASPEPGFFKVRLVRGGPWVAARIFRPCPIEVLVYGEWQAIDRWPALAAEIDGESCPVDRVWLFGNTITQLEFEVLGAKAGWARAYQPEHPQAKPRERVNRLTMPVPF